MPFSLPLDAPRSLLAVAREWWRPILTALGLCLFVLFVRPSDSIDRRISDRLMVGALRPADTGVLIVEITAADLRKYGGPPISRRMMALALERLADGGARRVLMDVTLAQPLGEADDAQLETAMARLGPQRLGLVSGLYIENRPFERFARHATVLDSRLTADPDGWQRRIGATGSQRGAIAARWLANGELDSTPLPLDLRVASWNFRRKSMQDVIDKPEDYAGKLVVISANADVAPTRVFLPLTGYADRASIQAMGAQSASEGYPTLRDAGRKLDNLLQFVAVVLGFFCALTAKSGRKLILGALATGVVLMAADIWVAGQFASEIYPVGMLSCFMVMVNVTLVQRLKVVPMMTSFLKGDISPEEAWAWRSFESTNHAVLLFSANGSIKRSNPAAAGLIAELGDRIVPLCLPRIGERAEALSFEDAGGQERAYAIDWPYAQVPVAILRDTSDALAVQRQLQRQLLTDELTGTANRRGFEYALNRANRSGGRYAVIFIDMNGFKAVNDTHGHDAGDELLAVVAQRLSGLIERGDTVARLGGDEFALVLPGREEDGAVVALSERIVATISEPVRLGGGRGATVHVGAAVGHALPAFTGEDTTLVVRRADQRMYRDKLDGKLRRAAA